MEEQRARREAHDAKDAVQSLREHALDFAADKTRGGKVEIGKREHVALDARLLENEATARGFPRKQKRDRGAGQQESPGGGFPAKTRRPRRCRGAKRE